MEPLIILIGRQSDGCTYQLHPRSRKRIQEAFPETRIAPSVFVGYEGRAEFENLHAPMWGQIAQLLTGLSRDRLEVLGGVTIYDPATEETRKVA